MIRFTVLTLTLGMLAAGCNNEQSQNPAAAQHTYGTPVDATEAIPAPVVAVEDSFYVGRSVTVDGRIVTVEANGCKMHLATDAVPLIVTAPRTGADDCAWQVPTDAQGFAVAAGTLRIADDTLRLTANGVRGTPVRISSPDS